MYIYVTMRHVHATIVAVEEQKVVHIPSVCLWPLVSSMQHECTILSSVACPLLQCLFPLYHNQHSSQNMIKNVYWFSCKDLLLSGFNET
jgi:hypothetical protein